MQATPLLKVAVQSGAGSLSEPRDGVALPCHSFTSFVSTASRPSLPAMVGPLRHSWTVLLMGSGWRDMGRGDQTVTWDGQAGTVPSWV